MPSLLRIKALSAIAKLITFSLLWTSVRGISDSERTAKLMSTAGSKSSNLLSLSTETLMKYVEAAPRSYSLFVFFTADATICQPCGQMQKQVMLLASEYRSLSKSRKASHPVFFGVLKLSEQDQSFLRRYNIAQVPLLFHFPRERTSSSLFPRALAGPEVFDVQRLGYSVNTMRYFVNMRVGSQMKVVRGGYSVPFVETVRQFMPIIVMAGIVFCVVSFLTGIYKHPMYWYALVVLVYIYSVGGGHFSWIHNTPLFTVNREGRAELIAAGSRSQYVAEGFIVSATCVGISAFIILVQELPRVIPNKTAQSLVGMILTTMTFVAISFLLTLYHAVSLSQSSSFLSKAARALFNSRF